MAEIGQEDTSAHPSADSHLIRLVPASLTAHARDAASSCSLTRHWPPFPYIYSPKETLPAATATEAVEEESASGAGHQAHQFDKSWEKGNQGRGTIAAFLGVSASYGRSQKRSKDRSQGQIQGHQLLAMT